MEWYYAIDQQRHGPVDPESFARLVANGTVAPGTLVWKAGMANWQPWQEVAPTVQLPAVTDLPPPVPSLAAPIDLRAEPVEEPLAYAGFWIRFLAKLIDGIVLAVIGNLVGMIFMGGIAQEMQGLDPEDPAAMARMFSVLGMVILVNTLLSLAYHWFFLAKFAATPGKLCLGLRIVRGDGSALSHGRIVGRFFAEYVSTLTLYIGYLIAAFDDQKRALHDYLCDTRVVKRR